MSLGANGTKPIKANKKLISETELFEFILMPESEKLFGDNETLVAIRSIYTNMYLTARDTDRLNLYSDMDKIGTNEKFNLYYGHNNQVGMKSKATGKYLTAFPNKNKNLVLDRSHFQEWEMFEIVSYL